MKKTITFMIIGALLNVAYGASFHTVFTIGQGGASFKTTQFSIHKSSSITCVSFVPLNSTDIVKICGSYYIVKHGKKIKVFKEK